MYSAQQIREFQRNSNVRAYTHVIKEGETDQTPAAYYEINGGGRFSDFSKHPYEGLSTNDGGKAAGAYQFIPHTWGGIQKRFPDDCPDFSPASQDFAAVADICGHPGAIEAIIAGDLPKAAWLLRDEWVSLPKLSADRVRRVFTTYGGTEGTLGTTVDIEPEQPAAPIEEQSVQVQQTQQGESMPLLLSLLPTILGLFAPRAQAALSKVSGNEEGAKQLVQTLIDKGSELVNVPADQPIQVVAALQKAQPAVVQQLEDHALDYLDKVAPMLDRLARYDSEANAQTVAAQNAASTRAGSENLRPYLALAVWIFMGVSLAVLSLIIGLQVYYLQDHKPQTEFVVGLMSVVTYMLARVGDVYGYAFGGVQSSRAGDIAATAATKAVPKNGV